MIAGIRRRIEQQAEALATARRFASEVSRRFSPLSAVLFGSFARGDFHDGSDLDVVLVSDRFPEKPMDREEILYELSPGGIDIFAYRRHEFLALLRARQATAYFSLAEGTVLVDDESWFEGLKNPAGAPIRDPV